MKKMYGMYLRKSRSDDPNEDINDTLAKHEKILFDLADSLNINRKEIMQFKEVVSGENIQNRPEMKKLLEYVMEGVLEGVLVVDSQRLARGDTVDQGTIIRAFSINNTKIITPMKTIDPQNEYDQEYFEFDLFMGRREYKMITRRMQRGRHIAAQEGYYVGSIAPYSYSRIKLEKGYSLEIYEEENIVFNIMKKKALEDEGSTNISNHLNELGYKPRKGEYWTKSAVEAILLNETNLGLIKWNSRKEVKVFKDGKIVKTRPRNPNYELYPGQHPAIMTQDEYDRIKFLMKKRSHPVKKDKTLQNPLAGLIVCGFCNHKMARRPYKNGRVETILCTTSRCKNVASDIHVVEQRIIDTLKDTLKNYTNYVNNYSVSVNKTYDDNKKLQLEECDKELEKLNKQIIKACEMLELGAYTVELFKERKNTLENKINTVNKRKDILAKETEAMKIEQYKKAIPQLQNAIDLYWKSSTEEKNKILKSIIDKCIYKKEKGGRWDPDAIKQFKLEIYLKV